MARLSLQIGVLVWFLLSFPTSSVYASSSLQICQIADLMEVEAAAKGTGVIFSLGVRTDNPMTKPDLDALNGLDISRWLNVLQATPNANNFVEIGWRSYRDTAGVQHWEIIGRRRLTGGPEEQLFNISAVPDHDYQFSVKKPDNPDRWRFRAYDLTTGQLIIRQNYHAPFGSSRLLASQERKNYCAERDPRPGKETHFLRLSQFNGTTWADWPNMTLWESNDPNYYADVVTDTELWVRRL